MASAPSQPSDARAELKIPKSPVVILMIGFLDASWHFRIPVPESLVKECKRYSPKMSLAQNV